MAIDLDNLPEHVWFIAEAFAVCPTCGHEDTCDSYEYTAQGTVMGAYYEPGHKTWSYRLMYGDYNVIEVPVKDTYGTKEDAEKALVAAGPRYGGITSAVTDKSLAKAVR